MTLGRARCSRRSARATRRACSCSNKADLLDEERREEISLRYPDAVLVSAVTGEGLAELGERIEQELAHTLRRSSCWSPTPTAAASPSCTTSSAMYQREDTAEGVRVHALVPARLAERFARFAVAAR